MPGRAMIALDGHDASGKTTLARLLAERMGGVAVRPFAGETGRRLLRVAESAGSQQIMEFGDTAIRRALRSTTGHGPVVLDRGWMTVASLVPWETFLDGWELSLPTILCWSGVDTTLARLGERNEPDADRAWHKTYVDRYLELAARTGTPVLDTDSARVEESVRRMMELADEMLGPEAGFSPSPVDCN